MKYQMGFIALVLALNSGYVGAAALTAVTVDAEAAAESPTPVYSTAELQALCEEYPEDGACSADLENQATIAAASVNKNLWRHLRCNLFSGFCLENHFAPMVVEVGDHIDEYRICNSAD